MLKKYLKITYSCTVIIFYFAMFILRPYILIHPYSGVFYGEREKRTPNQLLRQLFLYRFNFLLTILIEIHNINFFYKSKIVLRGQKLGYFKTSVIVFLWKITCDNSQTGHTVSYTNTTNSYANKNKTICVFSNRSYRTREK